jgi:flagellar hook-associated protein 1 FlgK
VSVSSILNIAKSALAATQVSLQVTSHNVANVNTEGYSRQEAVLEQVTTASCYGIMGNGVAVKTIRACYDQFLENSIGERNTGLEEQKVYKNYLDQIQTIFNEDNSQLSQNITDFFDAWQDLSTDPTSTATKQSVVSAGEDLSAVINSMYQDLATLQLDINTQVRSEIDEINAITDKIAQLNESILRAEVGTVQANDYVDQRNQLLKQLSGKFNITTLFDENNQVTVLSSSGRSLVDGKIAYDLVQVQDETTGRINVGWKDSSGFVSDITSQIESGTLGGLLQVRDGTITSYMNDLDSLAESIITTVNYFHQQGSDNAGISFFQGTAGSYAQSMALSGDLRDVWGNLDLTKVQTTAVTTDTTGNSIALRIASPTNASLLGGNSVTSKAYADYTTTALGIAGTLMINGVGVTIADTDTLDAIRAKIQAVAGSTGVSAAVADTRDGFRLVLTASTANGKITVMDGGLDTSADIADTLGLGGVSYTSYTSGVISRVGEETATASDLVDYNESAVSCLEQQRADMAGVSIDDEMANLIKFQSAYQAASRLYTVANELLKTLMGVI